MLIEAALNGGRYRSQHPAIPQSPDELAQAARESAAAVRAVRGAIPGTPFGVSTGAWILKDAALRHKMVSEWKVLPDFASVNFKEEGAVELASLLASRGLRIEAGLSDALGAEILVTSGLAPSFLRILLEPQENSADSALANVSAIEAALKAGGVKLPLLLHGLDATAWELLDAAAARGYDTRVGFEDVLTLPSGALAASNAELIAEAARRTALSPRR
jgi:uncharacterized protein (DUF849 family)